MAYQSLLQREKSKIYFWSSDPETCIFSLLFYLDNRGDEEWNNWNAPRNREISELYGSSYLKWHLEIRKVALFVFPLEFGRTLFTFFSFNIVHEGTIPQIQKPWIYVSFIVGFLYVLLVCLAYENVFAFIRRFMNGF